MIYNNLGDALLYANSIFKKGVVVLVLQSLVSESWAVFTQSAWNAQTVLYKSKFKIFRTIK